MNQLKKMKTTGPAGLRTVHDPAIDDQHMTETRGSIERPIPTDFLAEDPQACEYHLHLFVTGTPRCAYAIRNILGICQKNLPGRYILEIVDIYKHPERARAEQIIAIPTLVRQLPSPVRILLGDMSDSERVLTGLGIMRDSF